jgi:hypothetical protein
MGLKVRCPECSVSLVLPEGVTGGLVRCTSCRHVFQAAAARNPAEDKILSWLFTAEEGDQELLESALGELSEGEADAIVAQGAHPAAGHSSSVKTMPPPPRVVLPKAPPKVGAVDAGLLRLVSLERRGVLFEFATECLHSEAFRAAIPQECAHCRGHVHLSAHLVIYAPQMRDSISLEAEHKAGQLTIPQEQLGNLEGAALLAKLPEVPNVPPPANLPMPYWVCDMCNGAGEISAQIHLNTATGKGHCRLVMRNLTLAVEFLANATGSQSKDYQRLHDFVAHIEEDRWDALPSVIRHRVEQWYRPIEGERFLAYIPDRHFVRTEDGMAGMIVSNRRVTYHRVPLHQEMIFGHKLTLMPRPNDGHETVTFEAVQFKRRALTVDRSGMMLLRRSLAEGHYDTEWK